MPTQAALLPPLALANGVAVSTLYWGQAVVPLAIRDFGASAAVGLMPGATLAGYAAGVAGLAFLGGDLTSPRGMAAQIALLLAALAGAAVAPSAAVLAASCFCIGVGCALTQRMLACATAGVGAERRAQTIGWIIASGLCGIVLARSLVPEVAEWLGWRGVFAVDVVIAGLTGLGALRVAARVHTDGAGRSTAALPGGGQLWASEKALRRAALQQAAVFAAFNMGWGVFLRVLPGAPLAMATVAGLGALAAIGSGRLCAVRPATAVARSGAVCVAAACVVLVATLHRGAWFGIGMALLDVGTQIALVANHARGQALVSSPAMRGRVAAIITTVGFIGGAIGSAVGNLLAWTGLIAGP